MKQRIFLVRHGSLPDRVLGRIVGHCDVELSERGRREAIAIGHFLKNKPIEKVWVGQLFRAEETFELAKKVATNLPAPISDGRLNEMDFGDWHLTKNVDHPRETWRVHDPEATYPNGENIGDFINRTRAVLAEIRASNTSCAALFSHGGVIMGLLADVIGLGREKQFNLWVERGGLAEIEFDEDGSCKLCQIVRPLNFMEDQI